MKNEDFTFQPEPKPAPPALSKRSAQQEANELARRAASLCWRITNEHPDPKAWKAELEAAPAELRECLREYLLQKYKALQDRRRREAGKRSEVGDTELAKIGEIARRL